MRLGLLGPATGDLGALAQAAEFLLNGARVHRAIYLGNDGALDRAVAAWAKKLVGKDPTDDGAWRRAAAIARAGTAEELDRFVTVERARLRLQALESLSEQGLRTMEMLGDRVAILIHDKALLDEEDILPASFLFFGKSDGPLVKKIGARWFVGPGPIGSPGGGIAVVDDEQEDIRVTVYDSSGNERQRELLTVSRTTKMRVQGEG